MKKFLYSLAIVFLTLHTVSAKNLKTETSTKVSIDNVKISTLCRLIKSGDYEAVKILLDNGTNINRKSTGLTPLMFAARYNRVKIVKLLINRGAKLKLKSKKGYTALKYAEISKAKEAYKVIKEAMEK
ncbi:ankyrin repeat domain-containing protein [Tenacibaculum sp.]|nr:ankyrin repeat domain-containing protein [Tenacibaculum sp.]